MKRIVTMIAGAALALGTQVSAQDDGSAITLQELTSGGQNFPTDLKTGATHTELANYAWRLFIAAVQGTDATLTNGTGRETPNADGFAATGANSLYNSGANPVVFESLYHRTEAFPFYLAGQIPASTVGKPPVYTFGYVPEGASSGTQPVAYTVPANASNYVNLDETNQIGQNMLYYLPLDSTTNLPPSSGPAPFPTLFMAKVNSTELNYARGSAPTTGGGNGRTPPASSATWLFPATGSGATAYTLEVKTAWRRVGTGTGDLPQSESSKYHTAKSTWYQAPTTETGTPTVVTTDTFALIGIHIIQKTKNYPSFIFTSFEHVDATVRNSANEIINPYYQLLYDKLFYDTDSLTASPNGAYNINALNLPAASNALHGYKLPPPGDAPSASENPVTYNNGKYVVARQPYTISKEVNDVNNQIYNNLIKPTASLKDNVWANYRLKGVQGVPTSNQGQLDYFLANIVIETSPPGVQLFRGGVAGPTATDSTFSNKREVGNISFDLQAGMPVPTPKYTMGGCMGCHGRAQQIGQDFSFVSAGAGYFPNSTTPSGRLGLNVDTVPNSQMSTEAALVHNRGVARKRSTLFGY